MSNFKYSRIFNLILFSISVMASGVAAGDIGGTDMIVFEDEIVNSASMDIASNGDIYLASGSDSAAEDQSIKVYRSTDGGTTWDLWGAVEQYPFVGVSIYSASLCIAEGLVNKCYIAFLSTTSGQRLFMSNSDLSAPIADFSSPVVVMDTPGTNFSSFSIDIDDANYSEFYIYVVASGQMYSVDPVDERDIYFSRSTDQGLSFSTPYIIGADLEVGKKFKKPKVSYGFGDFVNVVWEVSDGLGGYSDNGNAVRYRRAVNAANDPADWGTVSELNSIAVGTNNRAPIIKASTTGSEVVIACERRGSVDGAPLTYDPATYLSTDSGLTFPSSGIVPTVVSSESRWLGGLAQNPTTGEWILGARGSYRYGIHRAFSPDLTSWSAFEKMSDIQYYIYPDLTSDLALNPANGWRPAIAWPTYDVGIEAVISLMFDAEWRGDPGNPNLEAGFPVDLPAQPISPPALADLNSDGDLEIIFGDADGYIQVYQLDGTPLPGWPIKIAEGLSESPIAVGDLTNNGQMSIVVGGKTGLVYCFTGSGIPAVGNWPAGVAADSPAFVAIGAFGRGPSARGIASISGKDVSYLDYMGRPYPGSMPVTLGRFATHAPALGDVDGDGLPEAVFACGELLVVDDIFTSGILLGKYMPGTFSGSPSLGDMQLDGDMEIVVPMSNGQLHVYDADGSELPGFPFTTPSASPLSAAALGNLLGNSELEIAFAARDNNVHVVFHNGNQGSGWPTVNGGWDNSGGPVIAQIDGGSHDVVQGTLGSQVWAWTNFSTVIPGWPLAVPLAVQQTPAVGDIDLDASNEVVLLTTNQLVVLDVNQGDADPYYAWQMAGHDAQRTSCYDCVEDIVSPVPDDPDVITRVSFAPPSPNPSTGLAQFRFSIPGLAVINLEVFDVRGHRVSLVRREEAEAGHHVANWNGRGDGGQALASGVYFAKLRVQGPGIGEELTRKVILTR